MSNKMNLPWVVFPINRSRASILDERGAYIVENVFTDTAAHIVRCVNAHDGLVNALDQARNRMLDMMQQDDGQAYKEAEKAMPMIDEALTAARGEVDAVNEMIDNMMKEQK